MYRKMEITDVFDKNVFSIVGRERNVWQQQRMRREQKNIYLRNFALKRNRNR